VNDRPIIAGGREFPLRPVAERVASVVSPKTVVHLIAEKQSASESAETIQHTAKKIFIGPPAAPPLSSFYINANGCATTSHERVPPGAIQLPGMLQSSDGHSLPFDADQDVESAD
jgi:hypothetical protein